MKRIIYVDPQTITKACHIGGGPVTRSKSIADRKLKQKGVFLCGDWDLNPREFSSLNVERDYKKFVSGEQAGYKHWETLYKSIKHQGYQSKPEERYVEVALDRNGEWQMCDGRHRLYVAQILNVPLIPVEVLFVNPNICNNQIMPDNMYQVFQSSWDKTWSVYHSENTVKSRLTMIQPLLPQFTDKIVLDVGMNSGLLMWIFLPYVRHYIGVEKNLWHFKQAQTNYDILKEIYPNKTNLINDSFERAITKQCLTFDVVYASLVLYHLNDKEVKLFEEKVLTKCSTAIIPTRIKERSVQKNSYHFTDPQAVASFLNKAGFQCDIINFCKGIDVVIGVK